MAGSVYSTKFCAAASFSGGPTAQFTVPDGKLAVVKTMTVVYGDITASGFDGWFQDDTGCKLARYTWASILSDLQNFGGTALWFGSWVLDEAQTLYTQTVAGTGDFYASGYLLDLP